MKKLLLTMLAAAAMTACATEKSSAPSTVKVPLNDDWEFSEAGKEEWKPAKVPGTVHTDLLRAGVIEDPFYRDNEKKLQWIDKLDWVYRTRLTLDSATFAKNHLELRFEGLDTYATVTLNGKLLLLTDNMFRTWTADIKPSAKIGENLLEIRFDSPTRIGLQKYDAYPHKLYASDISDQSRLGGMGDKQVSVHVRKAPSHFGWDWGPRFVTSGIWKPVWLCGWDEARVTDIHYVQQPVADGKCLLRAKVEIASDADQSASILVSADGKQLASQKVTLKKGVNTAPVEFTIRNPRLWWPSGMGEQNLYNIETKVVTGNGTLADLDRRNIGIRTVRLVQEPDQWGRSFYFEVNGIPMYAKGANVIPLNSFIPECGKQDYVKLAENAIAANMNMLRVWGGGCYGDDALYDACDSLGLLVWQDFMFACSMYPTSDEFLQSVKAEATDNIRRLRNHPSLALWCGNNEMGQGWWNWGWQRKTSDDQTVLDDVWKGYERIFHTALPELVAALDPEHFYWPTSPCSDVGKSQNHESGDTHYWGYRNKQLPYTVFRHEKGRFMSEFGFNATTVMKSFDKYTLPQDRDFKSDVFLTHVKCPTEPDLLVHYFGVHYNAKEDFASQVYSSQLYQYDALKYTVEQQRLSRPFCMGSLIWQINDCWPVTSWATIDYYGEWKAGHYCARRVFAPTIVAADLSPKGNVTLYGITDGQQAIPATLVCRLTGFDGKVLSEHSQPVELAANTSTKLYAGTAAELLKGHGTGDAFLYYAIEQGGRTLSENTLFFTEVRDLKLPPAEITRTVKPVDGGFELTLTAPGYVRGVEITAPGDGAFVSDNYFDLLPGVGKTVTVTGCGDANTVRLDHYLNHRK